MYRLKITRVIVNLLLKGHKNISQKLPMLGNEWWSRTEASRNFKHWQVICSCALQTSLSPTNATLYITPLEPSTPPTHRVRPLPGQPDVPPALVLPQMKLTSYYSTTTAGFKPRPIIFTRVQHSVQGRILRSTNLMPFDHLEHATPIAREPNF
jgi:hypothetical protein